jgi:hypothetical protein
MVRGTPTGGNLTIADIIHRIATDSLLQTMLAVLALDLVLGILAAFKLGTFNLAYLTNFMRNDVLGKVVPWAVLDVFAIVAGGANIVVAGVDFTNIAHVSGVAILAALTGSILGSLTDLGLPGIPSVLGSAKDAQPAGSGR